MEIIIRKVKVEDAEEIYKIRQMNGVMENILAYPGEPQDKLYKRIQGLGDNDYWFVAEVDERPVGLVALSVHPNPRKKHVGHIAIMVNEYYHGRGIGTKLMEYVIYISDNELNLKRLELFVFSENLKAYKLYKKLGFQEEGVLKASALRYGHFSDEILMARVL
ncbi:GNAT family N-acetyltransferase [Clostridium polynesiense]|uniref:GNAT family N-acetyltransferase n=1 Tax=Clostridium polynesiense TaxID=1325933 RepID=UPI00058CEE2A|nr:GNAT family N-acetyltransferase [Clostridium polynesiense]